MGPRTNFCYCQTVGCLLMWGPLSDDRSGQSCTIAAGPLQRRQSCSQSLGTWDLILLFQIRDSANRGSQVPVFISPRNRVAQMYSKDTAFPFLRLLRLAGLRCLFFSNLPPHMLSTDARFTICYLGSPGTDHTENIAYNTSSVFRCVSFLTKAMVYCHFQALPRNGFFSGSVLEGFMYQYRGKGSGSYGWICLVGST
jgi:hypothetical protein